MTRRHFYTPTLGLHTCSMQMFLYSAKLSLGPCNPPGLASAPHAFRALLQIWSHSLCFIQILHTNQSVFILKFVIWQRQPKDSGSEASPEFTRSSISPRSGDHDRTTTGTRTGPVRSSCLHGLSRQTSALTSSTSAIVELMKTAV